MSVKDWSTTPATNASFYFAEGQLPSTVNDNARGLMADVREWWGQITAGTISGTVGGTGETITLTPTPAVAYASNQRFVFKAPGSNTTSAPTLNVSAAGAKTLKMMGLTLPIPAYTSSDMLLVVYDGTDFQLISVLKPSFARNDQTGTTYTLLESDRFRHLTFNNASAVAVTVPRTTTSAFINGFACFVENKGAGTVTFTPTTSTINGAATATLLTGQWGFLTSDSVDAYRLLKVGAQGGKQSIFVPAGAMIPSTTNGAVSTTTESTTNKVMRKTMDFADGATVLHAQFGVRMPKSWNAGTVTFVPIWSANSTSTNSVVWQLKGLALSDNDTIDTAFGTAVTVTDANTATALQEHQGTESAAITIGNTPVKGDMVYFDISRDPTNGSDTLAATAQLDGVLILYTTDSPDDN